MTSRQNQAIQPVKLELLRPGPAHNQLLSPLTPYIVLCGDDGPVTVQMPFEHRQLLMRLRRLRYESDKNPVEDEQRQAEVRDMGEAIGKVMSQVPSLLTELGDAFGDASKLVHLSLSLSAFELGMIPFELAIGMDGFPCSGSPLFLQTRTPISLTREIRRGTPLEINWNRKPRILFAFAEPDGLNVPAQAHMNALRSAVEPWVKIRTPNQSRERINDVKEILTVLPNASLKQIRDACSTTEYTHVHILAHGARLVDTDDKRYGLTLCHDLDNTQDVVDGGRLAIALTARDSSGHKKSCPTLVSLATCDSGNIETVLTPGGSIAHELHAAGIPWVVASQFPLWMKASAIACEVLYSRLLKGFDPRWIIYELRQRLRTDSAGTHDWASIVAYATVPPDFEQQVKEFRDKQVRARLEIKFARIDELVGANADSDAVAQVPEGCDDEVKALCLAIRTELKDWREEPEVETSSKIKTERFGMAAASEKRIGIAYALLAESKSEPDDKRKNQEESRKAYRSSQEFYRGALEIEAHNHWVLTQFLSISAVLEQQQSDEKPDLSKDFGPWWVAARQIAEWQLQKSSGEDRAWALATLSELALLGVVYGGKAHKADAAKKEIFRNCKEMFNILGPEAFPIFSTRRQFKRYLKYWPGEHWRDLAEEALRVLGERSG